MNYDSFASTFSNSRKNLSWPELDSILDDIKKEGFENILDIGCGNGRFLEEAKRRGYSPQKYLGTDNSQRMIEEARKLHPDNNFLHIGMENLDTLSEGKSSFDAIIFLASFHHLESGESRIHTLEETRKLLSPHGKIYMTNWNLLDQEKYKNVHRGDGEFDIKIGAFSRYYHGFRKEELKELFEISGFKICSHGLFEGGRNYLSILSLPL